VGARVPSDNLTFGIDPVGNRVRGAWNVDRTVRALAQQKTMERATRYVASYDLAFGVETRGPGQSRPWEIDRSELERRARHASVAKQRCGTNNQNAKQPVLPHCLILPNQIFVSKKFCFRIANWIRPFQLRGTI
jgi:hypothetical protein